jgi:AraC-like DNA-binding protein
MVLVTHHATRKYNRPKPRPNLDPRSGLLQRRTVGHLALRHPLSSTQLTQLLFIQILRAQLQAVDYKPAGWLRAIADPRIAPALRSMHGDPARSWSLNELAKACAMSRTTFAEYFRKVAGVAPLTYLTEWRMYLAERALREETEPVAVVARSLGYTSESAFSNAFKRFVGKSPKAYRSAAVDS